MIKYNSKGVDIMSQTVTRKDVYRRLRNLPDDMLPQVIALIDGLEEHEPNEETAQALRDIRDRRDLVSFDSVDEMFAALRNEAEDEDNASD